MPLDGSFDVSISVMNRRNIARLSNGSHSPIAVLVLCVLARMLFSSLQREVFCCFVSAYALFSSLQREVFSFDLSSLKRELIDFTTCVMINTSVVFKNVFKLDLPYRGG